jgi:hypothetical protein
MGASVIVVIVVVMVVIVANGGCRQQQILGGIGFHAAAPQHANKKACAAWQRGYQLL